MPIIQLLLIGVFYGAWKLGMFIGRGIARAFSGGKSTKSKAAIPIQRYNDDALSNEQILEKIYRWGLSHPNEVAQRYLYENGHYHPELDVSRMPRQKYSFMFKKLIAKHPGTLNEYMEFLRWMAINDPRRFSGIRAYHPR